VYKRANLVN